jgi:outer membrane protein OmpA-like peptidoglycan-associated protein
MKKYLSGARARKGTIWLSAAALAVAVLTAVPWSASATSATTVPSTHAAKKVAHDSAAVPNGTPDSSQPSGQAPPAANAMTGYVQTYSQVFTGSSLPAGWDLFSGQPGGDPGAEWSFSHVVVSGDLLQLNTSQNSAGTWVSGGTCQCGVQHTYGAYFVRSRMTGPGPTQVELLWPAKGYPWPPEIDFDETYGPTDTSMATDHTTLPGLVQVHQTVNIDMTQWHTWGVIWTPTELEYTVDGRVWGQVTDPADIPSDPMTLDIQQQTWCASNWACPTAPASTDVNWVAEYSASTSATTTTTTGATATTNTGPAASPGTSPVTLSPFPRNTSRLTVPIENRIANLARTIISRNDVSVSLTGYCSPADSCASSRLSLARAIVVKHYLEEQLRDFNVRNVAISVAGLRSGAGGVTASTQVATSRVVARIS